MGMKTRRSPSEGVCEDAVGSLIEASAQCLRLSAAQTLSVDATSQWHHQSPATVLCASLPGKVSSSTGVTWEILDELFSNRFLRVSRLPVVSTKGTDACSDKGALEIFCLQSLNSFQGELSGVLVCVPKVCSVAMNKEQQQGGLNNALLPTAPPPSQTQKSSSSFLEPVNVTL